MTAQRRSVLLVVSMLAVDFSLSVKCLPLSLILEKACIFSVFSPMLLVPNTTPNSQHGPRYRGWSFRKREFINWAPPPVNNQTDILWVHSQWLYFEERLECSFLLLHSLYSDHNKLKGSFCTNCFFFRMIIQAINGIEALLV